LSSSMPIRIRAGTVRATLQMARVRIRATERPRSAWTVVARRRQVEPDDEGFAAEVSLCASVVPSARTGGGEWAGLHQPCGLKPGFPS
jgi:hypothetical protein